MVIVDIYLDFESLLSFEKTAKYSLDSDYMDKTISYLYWIKQSFLEGARFRLKLCFSHNSLTGYIVSIKLVIGGSNVI